ncbi:MAG: pyridoxal-phosphate dependent enzyme, partial [Dehalococcoidales bacterium]|nr:pyridoxal-phosphate dependent enzyme [Dehalococcoidales bacterium]
YWKGFVEYFDIKKSGRKPKMMGFQAEGAAPIVHGYPIEKPETVATAIRIGNPASWEKATKARDESGGLIDMVSDEEILAAQKSMAASEGVFGEPASAASFAGLVKMAKKGMDFSGKKIVCVITGSGLKDAETAIKNAGPFLQLPAELATIEKALGWK